MKHKALQEPKPFRAFWDKYLAAMMMVAALLISSVVSAQLDSAKYSRINGYGFGYKRMVFDSVLMIPRSTSPHVPYRAGAIRYNNPDSTLQLWTGNQWMSIVTGVGNGVDTAYMVNDTTLVIETPDENFFLPVSKRHVDSIYRKPGQDSIFYTVAGIERAIKDSAGTNLTLTNTGTGYSLVTTPNGSIKRLFPGYGVLFDSTTTANSITAMVDTSGVNPVVTTSDLNDAIAGAGGGQTLVSDLNRLSQIKIYSPAQGITSSNNVTNYSHTSVDSAFYKFSLTRAGLSGSEYGGWLTTNLTGDSIRLTAPFWVVFGDSQAEGHPGLHGRLHPSGSVGFDPNYPDSAGQLSYHLRYLTNMRWYNHGIGGETTAQLRTRFTRDVLAETSNPNDSRGTRTLSRKPEGVVIIGGINDVFSSTTTQQTKDNLEWMASMCQQHGIRCVILNLPGDAACGQTELRKIADINIWLRDGALDQYGACVVDYNRWWNDPAYGYDNIHPTGLIVDDNHPSAVGYDSLANYIYRSARLPKLTKAVVVNKLDPGGFSGFSRPTTVTINSVSYSIPNDSATIDITSYVPDSAWVKITASTNVTGTSYTGLSHWLWHTDNNVPDSAYYTRRTLYSGSQKSIADMAALKIVARDYSGTISPFSVNYADGSPALYTSVAGNAQVMINTGTALNNSTFTVNGSISNNSNIFSTGVDSRLGTLQVGWSGSAGGAGYGIGLSSTSAVAVDAIQGYSNNDGIVLRSYGAGQNSIGSDGNANGVRIVYDYLNVNGLNDTSNVLMLNPTLNNTTTSMQGDVMVGVHYKPTIISQGGVKLFGFRNTKGVNWFNQDIGWRTVIGDNNRKASAILELSRPKQGFLPPRMTTSQRDSIGYISAINISGGSYTIAPSISITGGTGSGATANCYIISGTTIAADIINHGIGYDPGSAVTVNLTGGTGSGASATAIISGPDTGLVIYNTTVDSLQYYNGAKWVNIGFEGISSFILKGTTNWTPGVVSAGSSTSTSFTVTGAAVGDPVTVSKLAAYSNGEIYDAFVSATNTVTLRVHNVSTGSANYSSAADYNVVVLKY